MWLCKHGDSKRFAGDPEFCKDTLKRFLPGLHIALEKRPSRSSHKNGIVKQNYGVSKAILYGLSRKETDASPATSISGDSFQSNIFKGSSILSAFKQARGYSPSVAGIPPVIVPQHLPDAHIEITAALALHKTVVARSAQAIPATTLHKGTGILVYYVTSKQNDKK